MNSICNCYFKNTTHLVLRDTLRPFSRNAILIPGKAKDLGVPASAVHGSGKNRDDIELIEMTPSCWGSSGRLLKNPRALSFEGARLPSRAVRL
jgi:hypothetical protein